MTPPSTARESTGWICRGYWGEGKRAPDDGDVAANAARAYEWAITRKRGSPVAAAPSHAVPDALIRKLSALPLHRIAEVEDFVDFIGIREDSRALTRAASAVSEPAFAAVWSNSEDDVYDAL